MRDQPAVKQRRQSKEMPCKARRKAKRAAFQAAAAAMASAAMIFLRILMTLLQNLTIRIVLDHSLETCIIVRDAHADGSFETM